MAYGGSQERGLIGAVAAGLHHSHSNARSELRLQSTHRWWQRWILKPLCEIRDGIDVYTSWVFNPQSYSENSPPALIFFFFFFFLLFRAAFAAHGG